MFAFKKPMNKLTNEKKWICLIKNCTRIHWINNYIAHFALHCICMLREIYCMVLFSLSLSLAFAFNFGNNVYGVQLKWRATLGIMSEFSVLSVIDIVRARTHFLVIASTQTVLQQTVNLDIALEVYIIYICLSVYLCWAFEYMCTSVANYHA